VSCCVCVCVWVVDSVFPFAALLRAVASAPRLMMIFLKYPPSAHSHTRAPLLFLSSFLLANMSPKKLTNSLRILLIYASFPHLTASRPINPSCPFLFPTLRPFFTISKCKALYQQLVSWPLAHVQKVKHPSLSASVLTLLCSENVVSAE